MAYGGKKKEVAETILRSDGTVKKKGALAAARGIMSKVFAAEKSAEVRIDENRFRQSHPHLPTGSVIIDFLIGGIPNKYGVLPCPGLPRGRLINLYGLESSGKTTMALTMAAETCRRGGEVLYIDWEHSIDIAYAKSLGVPIDDPDSFLLVQPETLEKGLAYLWGMAKAGVDLIIIDSVSAGATTAQWEQSLAEKGEIGRVGAKAAKWSEYLPQLKAMIARTNTCIIGISQMRSKIETGYGAGRGGPTDQAQGGHAWRFYSEVRLMLRRIGTEKGKRHDPITHTMIETAVANVVVAKIDKCKVSASQGREAKFYLVYGDGIDDVRSMIEMAAARALVKKAGAWFSMERPDGSVIKSCGMDAFRTDILNTPGAWEDLRKVALSALAAQPDAESPEEEAGEDDEAVKEVMAIFEGTPSSDSDGNSSEDGE